MPYITATDKDCRVRYGPGVTYSVQSYLKFGTVYEAILQGEWYFIPSLNGYSHISVVKPAQDPTVVLPAALPEYASQWDPDANQEQSDCGPACCCMFIRARGYTVTINKLAAMNPGEFTNAIQLQRVLSAYQIPSRIDRRPIVAGVQINAEPYSILLVNYSYLRQYAQDTRYTGWHWLVWIGQDPKDPTMGYVFDPDYWDNRRNEGNLKRYPMKVLAQAFRPYSGSTTTAIYVTDLPVVPPQAPVWTLRYVNSVPKYPKGINVRSAPSSDASVIGTGFPHGAAVSVDLNSLTATKYVKEQSGGWVSLSLLSETKPVIEPPSTPSQPKTPDIKFGWHVTYDTLIDRILIPHAQRMKGLVAGYTVISQPELANVLADYGYVMYREYFDPSVTYKTNWLNGLSEQQAYDLGYRFYYDKHYASTRAVRRAHYLKLVNECGFHPMDYAFWLGAMAAADKDGRKLAIFGDSLGTPKTAKFDNGVEEWTKRIPALRYAMKHGHVVTLNQYGRTVNGWEADFPVSDDNQYEFFGGRHEEFYRIVPEDCRPLLIIGETGASNSRVTHPWATDDAIKYSKKLHSRPFGDKILFISLYTLGQWENCRLDGQLPRAEELLRSYYK